MLGLTKNDEKAITNILSWAWWVCTVTYLYPHPELKIKDIREQTNRWLGPYDADIDEVVTILLLGQPNLSQYQKYFINSWSRYDHLMGDSFFQHPFHDLFRKYFDPANQGKDYICFMDVYPGDSAIIDGLALSVIAPEDEVILVSLMHCFVSKEAMYYTIIDNEWPFEHNVNYYDLCKGKYGKLGDDPFNFYMYSFQLDELYDVAKWSMGIQPDNKNLINGDFVRYRKEALQEEQRIIAKKKADDEASEAKFVEEMEECMRKREAESDNMNDTNQNPEIEELNKEIIKLKERIEELEKDCRLTFGGFSIAEGKKTAFIKLIDILNKLYYFEDKDGKLPTNRNKLINATLDKDSNISKLLKDAFASDNYMESFNDILDKASEEYEKR